MKPLQAEERKRKKEREEEEREREGSYYFWQESHRLI
jgi:hypothetical protein